MGPRPSRPGRWAGRGGLDCELPGGVCSYETSTSEANGVFGRWFARNVDDCVVEYLLDHPQSVRFELDPGGD
jgi:hypothetical protein